MNPPTLSNVSSRNGAPMGRPDRLPDDPQAPIVLHLERLPMVDGDYDAGGAYWGGPGPDGSMHVAFNDSAQIFVRAKDIADAQAKVRAVLPNATFDDATELDAFTRAYITAALWTFDDDAGRGDYEQSGRPDELTAQIDPASLASMREDCRKFCEANADTLALAGSEEQNGHDFWLTRNHHGSGYWDREQMAEAKFSEVGERLTEAAEAYGECNLYRGDDGRIYV